MSAHTLIGMILSLVFGWWAGMLVGGAFLMEERRESRRLQAELDTAVRDLTALRVEAEWDRFEEGRAGR
jgi:hypothetical protein